MSAIEITTLAKTDGPLTKRISLAPNGSLHSDGSACIMAKGRAQRATFHSLEAFAACIGSLAPHEAIALGALRGDLPDAVKITTKTRLNGSDAPGDLIARTGQHIMYRRERPGLVLIDHDTKGMPSAVRRRIDAAGGFWPALVQVLPELADAGRVVRASTSAGIYRTDTGDRLPGSNGLHTYIPVTDGADAERFLRRLHDRCWLHGLGWLTVGAGGQLLDRSIVDRMVGAPERLVFEGAPVLDSPLAQDQASRVPNVTLGADIDTRTVCPDLSIVEEAELSRVKGAAAHHLAPQAAAARGAFITKQATSIAARTGATETHARRIAEQQCHGVLRPGIVLPFDDDALADATVADVLADPARFVGETLADPLEGVDYGRCKAKVMQRPDGSLWIHSFAHGRTVYELRYDARSVEAALRTAVPAEAADLFVRLVLAADVDAVEAERLRDIAAKLAGVGKRAVTATLKAARAEQNKRHASAERERRAAQARDVRVQIDARPPDAEVLPSLFALDDVLNDISGDEPPARDAERQVTEARERAPILLHEMLNTETNPGEPDAETPPPAGARHAAADAA